jgi:hypothetical protein
MALLVALGACGGDDSPAAGGTASSTSTTTSSAQVDCPSFRIGEVHDLPEPCLDPLLHQLAASQDVTLEADAAAQAKSLCRSIDVSGIPAGVLTVMADWETGAKTKPASDVTTFVPLAVAVYCPQHYDELRAAG